MTDEPQGVLRITPRDRGPRERLAHRNVGEKPRAAYLFIEDGARLGGVRLFLCKLREETDHLLIAALTRPSLSATVERAKGPKFLVTFAVEKALPLVGAERTEMVSER